ncbi:MAG: glycosyltransferase [Syntrophorhabdaceae bacterium]|nr:glycosyltransferase [Syntrophorhabdaceae bacterium]
MIVIGALCWNESTATRQWIDSTRKNSKGHEIKILAIDNGSTDEGATWEACKLADWHDRTGANENLSKGYNRLLRKSLDMKADLVCLANNDIIVGPHWLDAIVREFEKNPKRYLVPHECLKDCENVDRDGIEYLKTAKKETAPTLKGTCLFFTPEAVRKFLPIPEELVLWYCDSWIHGHLKKEGYTCEVVLDSPIFHYGSLSFYKREDYVKLVAKDREIYNKLTGENL